MSKGYGSLDNRDTVEDNVSLIIPEGSVSDAEDAISSSVTRRRVPTLINEESIQSDSKMSVTFASDSGGFVNHAMGTDPEDPTDVPLRKNGQTHMKAFGQNGASSPVPSRSSNGSSLNARLRVTLERDALDWGDFTSKFGKRDLGRKISTSSRIAVSAGHSLTHCSPLHWIINLFPFYTWIRHYNLKSDLMSDVIIGFTVAVLHIPQGMAYGLLAGVEAYNGLYVSFFPVLIYAFMGTSRHISIGSFAVVSIMLRNSLSKLGSLEAKNFESTDSDDPTQSVESFPPTPLEAATAICLVTGLLMLGMGLLHLGSLSLILSDQLVSAFSCGSAVHVATSQMGSLLGYNISSPAVPAKLVFTWINLFKNITSANIATLTVSFTAMSILIFFKDLLEPRLKTRFKLRMPIPIDLIVIVAATAISYLIHLKDRYNVEVMGVIPTGLPLPEPPRLDFVPRILPDSFAIAIVSFAISLSLAKIYAKKHKYKIVPNQELIAIGSANVISSFFGCYPCASSLSRSSVQERAGGKTQVTSLVSCVILLFVLLFLGPLLFHLPKCILAGVILVALKGMFLQTKDFMRYWYLSRFEALTWLITFLGVILLDVDVGLVIGVLFSIFVVMIRFVIPGSTLLGQLPFTEIYVDVAHFKKAQEIPGIKIYQYSCSLFFMNRDHFKEGLYQKCLNLKSEDILEMNHALATPEKASITTRNVRSVHTIIIDCSTISYIDTSGVETLDEIIQSLKELGIKCYLTSCPTQILTMFERTKFLENLPVSYSGIFPSVHDAVIHSSPPPSA